MDIIINFIQKPVCILILLAFGIAVVIPWLKSKAEKTPTVLDDKIITLLELWVGALAQKFIRLFK